ncbi:MAG: PorT family protein [Prevotella sp.]|nr:PorT family protein [Prevotella sp.]MCM1075613.1 PorT family protein [Ruminococcus sp.]
MKKVSLLSSAILLSSSLSTTLAQSTHYEGNIFIGGHAGMTVSRTFFNPSVPQDMKLGAMVGVTFRYIEENHFGLIAELNFEQRGWKENFKEPEFKYSRTLNYLQIPVLAHIYFGSSRGHFYINAGPEIGFMVGDSYAANFDPERVQNISNFPLQGRQIAQLTESADPKIDFGISGGIGAEVFTNAKSSFTLEARFYYGLGNTLTCGRTHTFTSANAMSAMVSAGYWFRLK